MDKLRCGFCRKEFKYESEKKRHELSHSPRFQCKICDKKFSFISALKRHEKQHQRTGKVQCKQCSRKFRDESLLKRHIKYAHKGKYTCNKCNREFHSELALSTHKKTHNAKSDRKYHCSYDGCGKTFNFSHHLKHHESTHTNTRQYWCLKCKKGFIQHHHLKTHMKKHDPEIWLQCTEVDCKKKFPTDYSRRRHLLYVHNKKFDDSKSIESIETIEDKDEEVYNLCTVCGEVVSIFLFEDHQSKCLVDSGDNPIDLSTVKYEELQKAKEHLNQNICMSNESLDINDCKTALGSCIMNTDSTEDCLCAQIKTKIDDSHEIMPESNENINFLNVQTHLQEPFKKSNELTNIGCESCGCRNMCSVNYNETDDISLNAEKSYTQIRNCSSCNKFNSNIPIVELKTNGIIKLKDTFDSDIVILEHPTNNAYESEKHHPHKFVPYNSCQAVLGKCIVSSNGIMDEECLCAKMLVEEQQVTPEEIDEITPHPTSSVSNLSVI